MFEESDAGREGWNGQRRGGMRRDGLRRGALSVEFENAWAFAGWDAPVTIFGLTNLAFFG